MRARVWCFPRPVVQSCPVLSLELFIRLFSGFWQPALVLRRVGDDRNADAEPLAMAVKLVAIEAEAASADMSLVLWTIFRPGCMISLFAAGWAINVSVFTRFRIDYATVLGLTKEELVSPKRLLATSLLGTALWASLCFAATVHADASSLGMLCGILSAYVLAFTALYTWFPSSFSRRLRWRVPLARALWRCLRPVKSREIPFIEVLVADGLTSLAKVFFDLGVGSCVLLEAVRHPWDAVASVLPRGPGRWPPDEAADAASAALGAVAGSTLQDYHAGNSTWESTAGSPESAAAAAAVVAAAASAAAEGTILAASGSGVEGSTPQLAQAADVPSSLVSAVAAASAMAAGGGHSLLHDLQEQCSRSPVPFLLWAAPFLIRARQCVVTSRNAPDSLGKTLQLVNLAKYLSALPVVFFSLLYARYNLLWGDEAPIAREDFEAMWAIAAMLNTVFSFMWDMVMDWGLLQAVPSNGSKGSSSWWFVGLRPILIFRHVWGFYHGAIILNLLGRTLWSLRWSKQATELMGSFYLSSLQQVAEVFRRCMWNVLRVEWECIRRGVHRADKHFAV